MDTLKRYRLYAGALCVYDLSGDAVFETMQKIFQNQDDEAFIPLQRDLCRLLLAAGSLEEYLLNAVLTNDNAFTRAAAAGKEKELPQAVQKSVVADLKKLSQLCTFSAADIFSAADDPDVRQVLTTMPAWQSVSDPARPPQWDQQYKVFAEYHRKNGYGIFAQCSAFSWRGGALCPVHACDTIRLTDLKNYESQRQKVIDNTESFVLGYPANNVLLYGDRGTGKSSTVHAVLNEYAPMGLRMVELSKKSIPELPLLFERLNDCPMKFIIFIDDLSFDKDDDSFAELKAALEGSLSARQNHTLIYATTNRRHLVKETFSARDGDEVHRQDTIQEQMSLSDRFGLTVTFLNPDRKNYLEITDKLAADRGIRASTELLHQKAERWALAKGGRSPRCAKQFIDYVESCEKRGKSW